MIGRKSDRVEGIRRVRRHPHMKNPNFVSESIQALRDTLELSREYLSAGHSNLVQRNFEEAERLLTVAVQCVNRGLEIQENLSKHTKHHQCELIRILLGFIRTEAVSDLSILEVCKTVHDRGSLPPLTSVLH